MKPPSGGPISGPRKRRHQRPRHRRNEVAPLHRAQQDQPPDRRHHRATRALQQARGDHAGRLLVHAQTIEPATNTPIEALNTRFTPKRSAMAPLAGISTASISR
jgi:hypothetical protein